MPLSNALRACAIALAGAATALGPAPAAAQMTQFDQILLGLAVAGFAASALNRDDDDDDDRGHASGYDKTPTQYWDRGGHAPIIEPPRGSYKAPSDHGRARGHAPRSYDHGGRDRGYDPHHRGYEPRHRTYEPAARHAPHQGRRTLPQDCIRDVYGYDTPRRLVGADCLERRDVRAVLPGECRVRIHVGGRSRLAYKVPCLRQRGWRFQ